MPTRLNDVGESASVVCPACGSGQVSTNYVDDVFDYGSSNDRVQLRAVVPLHRCASCETEFTGIEAEELRHEAVCEHLKVLSPRAIAAIRAKYRMSRQRFADITRLGVATLARWESGEVVQNAALDIYLRLIARDEIFALVSTGALTEAGSEPMPNKGSSAGRFPALEASEKVVFLSDRARTFKLAA